MINKLASGTRSCECKQAAITVRNEDILKVQKFLEIPGEYRNFNFNLNLKMHSNITVNNPLFLPYLSKVYERLNSRDRLNRSLFISTDSESILKNFSYACLNSALRVVGTSVAPFWKPKNYYKVMLKISREDIEFETAKYEPIWLAPEECGRISNSRTGRMIDLIKEADVCFVDLTNPVIYPPDIAGLNLIISSRASRFLPTVIVSSQPKEELLKNASFQFKRTNVLHSNLYQLEGFFPITKQNYIGSDYFCLLDIDSRK
ncbi:hypothetical protein [Paenibacillus ferrarius]|uniref:hypothetical protein n=1 Tax=Paenibacillus ferrarius TaxID=1469647 RepID=UPI003D29D222